MTTLLLQCLAFAALATTMHATPARVRITKRPVLIRALKILACLVLTGSIAAMAGTPDWPIAIVRWLGLATLAAAAVTMTLTMLRPAPRRRGR
jgi:hypothetical protein